MESLLSKIDVVTPGFRRVYAYFYNMYRFTYGLACSGYICILCNIFGLSFILHINEIVATVSS